MMTSQPTSSYTPNQYFITYGQQSRAALFLTCASIMDDVQDNHNAFDVMVEKINACYFHGGVLAPKPSSALLSIEYPRIDYQGLDRSKNTHSAEEPYVVETTATWSWSAVLGYIEGIPIIGTAVAIITAFGHLIAMWITSSSLKLDLPFFPGMQHPLLVPQNTASPDEQRVMQHSVTINRDLFNNAVAYTLHRNHFYGALLSLVPFAKPITRLIQWSRYQEPAQIAPSELYGTPLGLVNFDTARRSPIDPTEECHSQIGEANDEAAETREAKLRSAEQVSQANQARRELPKAAACQNSPHLAVCRMKESPLIQCPAATRDPLFEISEDAKALIQTVLEDRSKKGIFSCIYDQQTYSFEVQQTEEPDSNGETQIVLLYVSSQPISTKIMDQLGEAFVEFNDEGFTGIQAPDPDSPHP